MELLHWITIREAGVRLHYTPAWIKHLIVEKQLRAEKTALGWLIDPVSVDAFKRKRDQAPAAQSARLLPTNERARSRRTTPPEQAQTRTA